MKLKMNKFDNILKKTEKITKNCLLNFKILSFCGATYEPVQIFR